MFVPLGGFVALWDVQMIDRFPVGKLSSRYGLGKTAVYDRLSFLAIAPFRDGRRSYITGEDLDRLDNLHSHLATGGTLETFGSPPQRAGELSGERPPDNQLAQILTAIATSLQRRSPLDNYRDLDEAVRRNWLLTSSQVEDLIGAKPSPKPGQNHYDRACWRFSKSGKIGKESAWRVERLPGFSLEDSGG